MSRKSIWPLNNLTEEIKYTLKTDQIVFINELLERKPKGSKVPNVLIHNSTNIKRHLTLSELKQFIRNESVKDVSASHDVHCEDIHQYSFTDVYNIRGHSTPYMIRGDSLCSNSAWMVCAMDGPSCNEVLNSSHSMKILYICTKSYGKF